MKVHSYEKSGVLVYELSGYLKGQPEGYEFLSQAREGMASGSKKIVVDLGGVDRIDSSGIGVLATAYTSAERAEATLLFANIPDKVRGLLTLVGLMPVLTVYPTLQEAIASLSG